MRVDHLPFLEMSKEDNRALQHFRRYLYGGVVLIGALILALVVFFVKLGSNLGETQAGVTVLLLGGVGSAVVALIAMTAVVDYAGKYYRREITEPHLLSGQQWLNQRYGLNLDREALTLLLGAEGSWEKPIPTTTGNVKRFGTVSAPGYAQGVQFVYSPDAGYQVIDPQKGQELPVSSVNA